MDNYGFSNKMKSLFNISVIFLLTFILLEIIMRIFTSSFYADEESLSRFRKPIDVEKVKGLKIAMLGDSYTYGVKVADEETLPYQLQMLLRDRLKRDDVYVDNFGISGTSTIEHYFIYKKYIEKMGYDVIVLNFFIDDFTPYYYYNTLLNEYKYCGEYMNSFEKLFAFFFKSRVVEYLTVKFDIFKTARNADNFLTPVSYKLIKMRKANSLRYRCAKARLEELGERITTSGKRAIFMLIPSLTLYDAQNPYPEEIANYETMAMLLAKRNGFEIVDSVLELREILDQRHLVKNDIHYNRQGYNILAELLAERIISGLGR